MAKFIGKKLNIEIVGESHSDNIKTTVKGFPTFTFDSQKLSKFLAIRKPSLTGSTARVEEDIPHFRRVKDNRIKNVFSFTIDNKSVEKKDYSNLYAIPRPSHADLAWFYKDGVLDFSGGGRFSGRLTVSLCVIGGICKQYLESLGIKISSFVSQVGGVRGDSYKTKALTFDQIEGDKLDVFPSLSNKEEMVKEIEKARADGDSVGGKIECVVFNMKRGIGDNLFSGLEGKISSLIYSIPAVKGVEFGLGFDFCEKNASQANDQIQVENGELKLLTNNNGGINGGISNGERITIGVAFKPTPSIAKEQRSVNLEKMENTVIKVNGRHDSCIVARALPCVESAVAIAILDEILGEL